MIRARHIFHAGTSGWDRIHAWQEATAEPFFVWGRKSGGTDGVCFGSVKREFKLWLEATSDASLTVYHDGIGSDALGPMDPCPHKIIFLHHWFPRWEKSFEWTLRSTGKILVGHPALVEQLRTRFAWIPERFIQCVPQPELKPTISRPDERPKGKPRTGVWLHGKPWRRYGNRLRSLVDRWPAGAGQLEIVTIGERRPRWAKKPHVVWSADLPLDFALYRLFTWDSTLLLNDYSLDAPWLRQALDLDVFPLIPEGEGIGRTPEWCSESAPRTYAWGEANAAIELLEQWRSEKDRLVPQFRSWRSSLHAEASSGAAFEAAWKQVKQSLLEQRPVKLRASKPIPNWYPVAWYERVQRLRSGL